MKKLIFLLVVSSIILKADLGSIQGRVIDSDDGEPLVNANVFLSGTTIGTTTNENGEFIISEIPDGNYKIVVSIVGYESQVRNLKVNNNDELIMDFELEEKIYEFDEVSVLGEYDEEFERNYLVFRKYFIGTSKNAVSCEIVNPEIINFIEEKNGDLIASSDGMLEIVNHRLGYNVKVNLKKFKLKNTGEVYYAGETFFEEIDTNDLVLQAQWRDNRTETYLGSVRHFFKTLYNDEWYSAGYRVYLKSKPTWNSVFELMEHEQPISYNPSKIIIPYSDGYKKIKLDDTMLIKFVNEIEAAEYYSYRESMDSNINEILPYQISWIELINDECEFDENGLLKYPDNSVKLFGYWGWLKMGDMLPFDYNSNES